MRPVEANLLRLLSHMPLLVVVAVRVSPSRAVPLMPGAPVAGLFAACCCEVRPEMVTVFSPERSRSPAAQGAPTTEQLLPPGRTAVISPSALGRMVTCHSSVRRSSQWAAVTVPPATCSRSSLPSPASTHTDSLNSMLKLKLSSPSWELGTLVNWAVSGCSNAGSVSFVTEERLPPSAYTWLPSRSRRKDAEASVGAT